MVINYLEYRKNSASMFIAVDIRRGVGRLDEAMLELCAGFNINANIMMKKSDKVSNSEKSKIKIKTEKILNDQKNKTNKQTTQIKKEEGENEDLSIIENSKKLH